MSYFFLLYGLTGAKPGTSTTFGARVRHPLLMYYIATEAKITTKNTILHIVVLYR